MGTRRMRPMTGAVAMLAALMVIAAPAMAHVAPLPAEAPAEGYTMIEFRVPHGCAGVPTETVTLTLNEVFVVAKAEAVPGWTVSYTYADRSEPVELHGQQVTTYVETVSWTNKENPLADDQYQTFGLTLKVHGTPGDVILVPTVQTCTDGALEEWLNEDPKGDHPAPRITLMGAPDEMAGHDMSGDNADMSSEHDHEAMMADENASLEARIASMEEHMDMMMADTNLNLEARVARLELATEDTEEEPAAPLNLPTFIVAILGLLSGGFALIRSKA